MAKSHSFSVDVAAAYNVDVALMLQHFCFWYEKVVSDGINKHKNEHWVRLKLTQLHHQFPYWGESKVRHLVDKMIALKLIKKDEFNERKNDRTKWYTLTKKAKQILNILPQNYSEKVPEKTPKNVTAEIGNYLTAEIDSPTAEIGNSINKEVVIKYSYLLLEKKLNENLSLLEIIAMQNRLKLITVKNQIKTFVKQSISVGEFYNNDRELFKHFQNWIRTQKLTDVNLEDELNWFLKMFNKISNRDFKITDALTQSFAKQFAVGFSGDEMAKAVKNLYSSSVANKFHLQHNFKFATPEYLLKDDNLNKYLNFKNGN
ncbi:hypothetical protein BA195_06675 [Tenacibaculum soleae]|uniref:Uncharacterized protein n=1 Tax=Tenacibaculum soleae TaxID=447689 RepID=A0A1B9Y3F4_9FLAO|nr:hypothetical protein [Tenacibaculum soleae]OCK44355.1 hypothetical protein BA195_06675 [Tenacibaculum soleae]